MSNPTFLVKSPDIHSDFSRVTHWYASGSASISNTVINDAYEDAKAFFEAEFPDDELVKSWMVSHCSMDDVSKALATAQSRYNSNVQSKTWKWLIAFSARISYFGAVLDVLVQQYAEYVSLVWGAFKFLFMAALNHEKMIKQLSKSLSQIADVLPRAELTLLLYPTERMRLGVAHLYASIIKFVRKAILWYKKGKLAHAFNSVINPWELEFQQDIEDIREQSVHVEANAGAASRAELRDAHLGICNLQAKLSALASLIENEASRQTQAALVQNSFQAQVVLDFNNQKKMLTSMLLTQILSLKMLDNLPAHGECLNYCQTLTRRRRDRPNLILPDVSILQQWAMKPNSSILLTESESSQNTKEFVVQLIGLIRSTPHPLIWALRFPGYWDHSVTFIHITQTLIAQALHLNPSALSNDAHALTAANLRDAVDESDWLQILNRALQGLTHVFIVIDAELLKFAARSDRHKATQWMYSLYQIMTSVNAKIFVSTSSIDTLYAYTCWDTETWTKLRIDMLRKRPELLTCGDRTIRDIDLEFYDS